MVDDTPDRSDRVPVVVLVAAAVASLPIVAGIVERIRDGWQPQADDAAIAWLSHDVFTPHSPLLGMPSTIGRGTAHHLGPMLFWVLALPERALGSSPTGLLLGVALVNVLAVVGVAVFAHRRLGKLAAVTCLVLLSLVTWSLGRQLFSSIWNPDIALLPLACFFVLVWSVADGDLLALPFAALTGSFVAQSNLLFTPLVAALSLWATFGLVSTLRTARRDGTGPPHEHVRRTLWITAAVLLAGWSTAIYEELTHRPGNVERVLRNGTGDPSETLGVLRGVHVMTRALGGVPFWSHPLTWERYYATTHHPPALGVQITAVGFLVVLIGAFVSIGRHDRTTRSLLGTALAGIVGGVVIVTRLPTWFNVVPYRLRVTWIVGMFAWFALVVVLARAVARMLRARVGPRAWTRTMSAAAVVLAATLSGLAILAAATPTQPFMRTFDHSSVVTAVTAATLARLPGQGPYFGELRITPLDGVGHGVLWGLERHGVAIRVDPKDPYLGAEHGEPGRQLPRLVLVDAASSYRPARSEHLLVHVDQRSRDERARSGRILRQLCASLRRTPPVVTAGGRTLARRHPNDPAARAVTGLADGSMSACTLVEPGTLDELSSTGALRLTDSQVHLLADRFDAFLSARFDDFAVYLQEP